MVISLLSLLFMEPATSQRAIKKKTAIPQVSLQAVYQDIVCVSALETETKLAHT